jgi:D-alanyl-D-alanine carboxypeptidase/D-alanyl-D-alanine-endopeptidase (penicillin-binding protein 4)
MRQFALLRFFLLLAAATLASSVAAHKLPAPVADMLKAAAIPQSALGVFVQQVDADQPLLAVNADMAFNPASTMKLVTTQAALQLLGPTFRWKTRAYFDGVVAGDVLHGDLIIKGSGDPKLVTESLWMFLRQIRARGIRDIRGNLILDRNVFDALEHDPSLFDGAASRPYNAGADALLLNYASFRFSFIPDRLLSSVTVIMDPPFAGFPIAAPRLTAGTCGDWRRQLGPVYGAGVTFAGTYALACGEKHWHTAPHHLTPNQYFGGVFRQLWHDLGGSFAGQVRSGVTPSGAALITEWESAALPEVIRDINKYSNNVMARQLLLTLAAQQPWPADAERAGAIIRGWLAASGIDAPELVIENGSGLSRIERIAPQTLGSMLVAAFQSPLMPEFMASLPLAGIDGTMRTRLRDRSAAGNAHLKSGSLDDVRAIAGYVRAASGKRYAVVSIINHPLPSGGKAVHDALVQWIHEQG